MEQVDSIKCFEAKEKNVQALLWTGERPRIMYDFLGGDPNDYMKSSGEYFHIDFSKGSGGLVIRTIDGFRFVKIGDYVIKHQYGNLTRYYSCTENELKIDYSGVVDNLATENS